VYLYYLQEKALEATKQNKEEYCNDDVEEKPNSKPDDEHRREQIKNTFLVVTEPIRVPVLATSGKGDGYRYTLCK
jgi:hypothetical protein